MPRLRSLIAWWLATSKEPFVFVMPDASVLKEVWWWAAFVDSPLRLCTTTTDVHNTTWVHFRPKNAESPPKLTTALALQVVALSLFDGEMAFALGMYHIWRRRNRLPSEHFRKMDGSVFLFRYLVTADETGSDLSSMLRRWMRCVFCPGELRFLALWESTLERTRTHNIIPRAHCLCVSPQFRITVEE